MTSLDKTAVTFLFSEACDVALDLVLVMDMTVANPTFMSSCLHRFVER